MRDTEADFNQQPVIDTQQRSLDPLIRAVILGRPASMLQAESRQAEALRRERLRRGLLGELAAHALPEAAEQAA